MNLENINAEALKEVNEKYHGKNKIEKARAEIKIKNIQKEINSLVDKYALAQLDVTRNIIKEKIDKNFELIEELKEVL